MQTYVCGVLSRTKTIAPFGDAYEKIGTIQRRLAWPLHKDDTLFQSGRSTDLNIYFTLNFYILFILLVVHSDHALYIKGYECDSQKKVVECIWFIGLN
jgi:hypothetical protein